MNKKDENPNAIGGFLDLEMPITVKNNLPPMLSCGRNGLQWIIEHIQCDRVYLPYYICPVVPDVLNKAGVQVEFYHINEQLMPEELPCLKDNEYFLYVNYFGVCDAACKKFIELFGNKLILDLTQAFFFDVPVQIKSFSSARKFIGVPDGCCITGVDTQYISELPRYNGAANAAHLLLRQDGDLPAGYAAFTHHGSTFSEMRQISLLSQNILKHIDFKAVNDRRQNNFSILHKFLGNINQLKNLCSCAALCYPLLLPNGLAIKKQLCENKIFVPTYWPNISNVLTDAENYFIDNLICLPIDQRYDTTHMQFVLKKICSLL